MIVCECTNGVAYSRIQDPTLSYRQSTGSSAWHVICSIHVVPERRSFSFDPPKTEWAINSQTVNMYDAFSRRQEQFKLLFLGYTFPLLHKPPNHRSSDSFMRQLAWHRDVACHLPRRVEGGVQGRNQSMWKGDHSFLCFQNIPVSSWTFLFALLAQSRWWGYSVCQPPGLKPRRDANLIGWQHSYIIV